MCVDLAGGGRQCYLDIDVPTHGFVEQPAPPSSGAAAAHPYLRDLVLACAGAVFDTAAAATGDATLCGATVWVDADDPARLVITARTVEVTGTLGFTGVRDVAILAYGDITVGAGAHLSVDAAGATSGAGALLCDAPAGSVDDGGGAGGSHGSAGGDGGSNGGGDQGGVAAAATAGSIHDVLQRGCAGGSSNYGGTLGGGAGGALQLSSGGTIMIEGAVSANGAGGPTDATGGAGGAGGGSGGDIFLQAERLIFGPSGSLTAQGGGGGAGSGSAASAPGGSGPTDPTMRAAGASTTTSTGGSGAGAAALGALSPATVGGGAPAGAGAGGGGGGAGRLGAALALGCAGLPVGHASPTIDCR